MARSKPGPMAPSRRNVRPPRPLPASKRVQLLQELGLWLTDGGSVSFAGLDRFRTALRLSEEAFAGVLDVSPATYQVWRRKGAVPSRNRLKMDEGVRRYWEVCEGLVEGLETGERRPSAGVAAPTTGRRHWRRAGPVLRTLTPSQTTPRGASFEEHPALYIATPGERQANRGERLASRAERGEPQARLPEPRLGEPVDCQHDWTASSDPDGPCPLCRPEGLARWRHAWYYAHRLCGARECCARLHSACPYLQEHQ